MTLPRERTQAMNNTREFLRNLLDPKKTPRVPKWIREEAYWCLKHYISEWELNHISKIDNTGTFG